LKRFGCPWLKTEKIALVGAGFLSLWPLCHLKVLRFFWHPTALAGGCQFFYFNFPIFSERRRNMRAVIRGLCTLNFKTSNGDAIEGTQVFFTYAAKGSL